MPNLRQLQTCPSVPENRAKRAVYFGGAKKQNARARYARSAVRYVCRERFLYLERGAAGSRGTGTRAAHLHSGGAGGSHRPRCCCIWAAWAAGVVSCGVVCNQGAAPAATAARLPSVLRPRELCGRERRTACRGTGLCGRVASLGGRSARFGTGQAVWDAF